MENINVIEIVLYALTAVGIIEWLKVVLKKTVGDYPVWIPITLLPLVAVGVGFSTLVPEIMIGLRIWAIAQISYPLLIQLPEKLIKKVG